MAMVMGLGEAVETGGEGAGLEEGELGEEEEMSEEEEEPSEEGVVGLIRPVKDLSIWLDENQVSD